MLKTYLTLVMLACAGTSIAQDTVSVMYYNLLNFPWINSGRITHLETIIQYKKPDLFLINELTSGSGANTILNSAMNTSGTTYYSKSAFVDGFGTDNMLYYNNEKFGLVSQDEISTNLRDINEYVLYYKEPGMTASSDTVYLMLYCAHLKAGNQQSNEDDRDSQATQLKLHLSNKSWTENVIVGGDFNIYGSSEAAYQTLISGNSYDLIDPLGTGAYHNNAVFAQHHTQSTRTTSIDDGATGGMDDRFDYILFNNDIDNNLKRVRMLSGSYKALGQDGLHFNDGLLDAPANTTVPSNVLSSLYYMSDHLPITMDLVLDVTLDNNEISTSPFTWYLQDKALNINGGKGAFSVEILGLNGQIISNKSTFQSNGTIDLSLCTSGIYFARIVENNSVRTIKFFLN